MTGTTKTVALGPFTPGMNNRRPDFKLAARAGSGERQHFVRSAVNTDITAEGTLKRRPGYASALDGSDCHSLWGNGDFGLYVDYDTLYRIGGSAAAPEKTALRTDMTPGRLMSCAEAAGSVYFSNGLVIGRIDDDGAHEIGVPPLRITPSVEVASGGALPAGTYLVCFTQHNAAGEESASTVPEQVVVGEGAILVFNDLPETFDDGITGLSIYVTAANDGTLLRLATLRTATASFAYAVKAPLGARCATLLLAPMPPGNIVREFNGRLLVAAGAALYYSEPYAYALTNPARNYVVFPAPITMLEPCDGGFYIAADKTYWVAGDIASAPLATVLPYGAVPNSSGRRPDENAVLWMSSHGMVRGEPSGEVTPLQEKNVAVESGRVGAFLYRERDGMKQALGALFGTSTGVAATSFIEAEVIRKATTV